MERGGKQHSRARAQASVLHTFYNLADNDKIKIHQLKPPIQCRMLRTKVLVECNDSSAVARYQDSIENEP